MGTGRFDRAFPIALCFHAQRGDRVSLAFQKGIPSCVYLLPRNQNWSRWFGLRFMAHLHFWLSRERASNYTCRAGGVEGQDGVVTGAARYSREASSDVKGFYADLRLSGPPESTPPFLRGVVTTLPLSRISSEAQTVRRLRDAPSGRGEEMTSAIAPP